MKFSVKAAVLLVLCSIIAAIAEGRRAAAEQWTAETMVRFQKAALDRLPTEVVVQQKHPQTHRGLEDGNNIGVYDKVVLAQCVTLPLNADEDDAEVMFADDTIAYTYGGSITKISSFVIVDVVDEYGDEKDQRMMTVATFLQGLTNYAFADRQNYCEACQNMDADGYCDAQNNADDDGGDNADDDGGNNDGGDEENNNDEGNEDENGDENENEGDENNNDENNDGEDNEGEDNNDEGDNDGDNNEGDEGDGEDGEGGDERRQLAQVEYVDCDECEYRYCLQSNDGNQGNNAGDDGEYSLDWNYNYGDEDIAGFVGDLTACQQLENAAWGDYNLYAMYVCSPNNNGITVGVFLDEECTIHLSIKSYAAMMYENGDENFDIYANSALAMKQILVDGVSCAAEAEYGYQGDGNNNNNNNNGNNNNQVNEFCGEMEEDDDEGSLSLYNCGGQQQNNNNNNNNGQQENDWDEYYKGIMDYEDAQDLVTVCYFLMSLDGDYDDLYDYIPDDDFYQNFDYNGDEVEAESAGLSNEWIIGIVGGLFAAIVLAVVCFTMPSIMKMFRTKRKSSRGKTEPLVPNSAGQMS